MLLEIYKGPKDLKFNKPVENIATPGVSIELSPQQSGGLFATVGVGSWQNPVPESADFTESNVRDRFVGTELLIHHLTPAEVDAIRAGNQETLDRFAKPLNLGIFAVESSYSLRTPDRGIVSFGGGGLVKELDPADRDLFRSLEP